MRWIFYHGANDGVFPAEITMQMFRDIFEKLGISETIVSMDIIEGQGHEVTPEGMAKVMNLVRESPVKPPLVRFEPKNVKKLATKVENFSEVSEFVQAIDV